MGNYQVLFSGDVSQNVSEDTVRDNLARELGIDERKARQLFSGRTVVIGSQLAQEDALEIQARFSQFGAICRIKDLTPIEPKIDYHIDRKDRASAIEHTLRDITAAHVECPRCGHLQLEASHCARCGIDIGAAIKAKRKEDLIIERKIREHRDNKRPEKDAVIRTSRSMRFGVARDDHAVESNKLGKVMSWLKKSS